jgi:hypothetical protein
MSSDQKNQQRLSGEIFDMNIARAAGLVVRLWPNGGDVYARLCLLRGETQPADSRAIYATLRFPGGKIKEQPISLQEGESINVSGYLTHNEYFETIQHFLKNARQSDFLEKVPTNDLPAWQAITFRRVNILLNVRGFQAGIDEIAIPGTKGSEEQENKTPKRGSEIVLEGIVARQWEYADNLFTRLAVYDRYTPIERGGKSNYRGRPRRKPHYITVRFSEKKVADRIVAFTLKDRLRVTGTIGNQNTRLTLHQALFETGCSEVIELLGRLPNADRVHEIKAEQESIHIEASSLIRYSS